MTGKIDSLLALIAKRRALGAALVLTLTCLMVAICFALNLRTLEEFEVRTWDWRLRLVADPKQADPNIKLIIIDQGTLDFFEQEYGVTWPFPRDIYTYVIEFLTAAGAKGLAFDLLFTESSAQAVESDQLLADASSGPLPVIHAVTMERVERLFSRNKFERFAARQHEAEHKRGFVARFLAGAASQDFIATTLPIPEIIEKAGGFGSVSAIPDSDGIFRHYSVGGKIEGVPILSLPFELYDFVDRSLEHYGIEQFLDNRDRLAIRLHGPSGTYPSFSLKDIAQSQQNLSEGQEPIITPTEFKDAWVILGVWAPGLLDLRPTPLEEKGKGVEFVATVLDNILHRDFVKKFNTWQAFIICVVLIGLSVGASFYFTSSTTQLGVVMFILMLFLIAALYLASIGVWIPVFLPTLSIFCSIVFSLGLLFQVEGRQHRFVRGAFQYYVTKGVIDQIMSDPSRLVLGGEKRELTIFFSDIKGFTSISEKLDPTDLVQLLNQYLTVLTELILGSGGTLDKYVGDAIVAFWNAPLAVDDHARRGIVAAIDCQKKLASLRDQFHAQYGVDLFTRIGIHTGLVSVGNFGSSTRFNYTMLGDAANLASRIEGVNKVFGTSILFTEPTRQHLGETVIFRKVGELRVIGKEEVVPVYQPKIDEDYFLNETHMNSYRQALALFDQGKLEEARDIFSVLNDDPVANAYVNRIELELPGSRSEFSPVWNMTEK